jgi:hypothetical protein
LHIAHLCWRKFGFFSRTTHPPVSRQILRFLSRAAGWLNECTSRFAAAAHKGKNNLFIKARDEAFEQGARGCVFAAGRAHSARLLVCVIDKLAVCVFSPSRGIHFFSRFCVTPAPEILHTRIGLHTARHGLHENKIVNTLSCV